MTPEERQLLGGLFQRVASTESTPRDAEAEAFINDSVRQQPHAPYVLAQTVLVQQQALEAAKKFNPQFKFHVIKARVEAPGAAGGYTMAPRYIVVATEGVPKFPNFPKPLTLAERMACS